MAITRAQEEFLAVTRKSQEAVIAAIKTWVETVKTATPKLAPLTDKLPKLPSFSVPLADRLPGPEETVASTYRLAEQVLASQRKFAEDLLKMMTPLMPVNVEDAQVTSAPESAPESSAPESSAPKSSAPASSAPESSAPEASAPAGGSASSTAKTTAARSAAKSLLIKPLAGQGRGVRCPSGRAGAVRFRTG
jgi:hypothetical protein